MTTLRIDAPEGQIKLGDVVIPGVYQSLEIEGAIKTDDVARSGRSGSSKLPQGWQDATARLQIRLLTEEGESYPTAALAQIGELFQGADADAKPRVYTLVHPAAASVRLRDVLFASLRISDSNGDDTIGVELEFMEFKPVALAREGRARKSLQAVLGADGLGQVVNDISSAIGDLVGGAADASYDAKAAIDKVNADTKVYSTSPNGLADMFENDPEGGGPLGIF